MKQIISQIASEWSLLAIGIVNFLKSFFKYRADPLYWIFSGSGKSALIKRHCEHRFVSRYVMTIGIDYGVIKSKYKEFGFYRYFHWFCLSRELVYLVRLFSVFKRNLFQLVKRLILESKIEQKCFNFDFWCRRSTIISRRPARILSRNRSSFISVWCSGGKAINWITEMDWRIHRRRWQYKAGSCYYRLVLINYVIACIT